MKSLALRRALKALLIGGVIEGALVGLHMGIAYELRDTPIAAAMLAAPGGAAAVMGGALVVIRILAYLFVPGITLFFVIVALVRHHDA